MPNNRPQVKMTKPQIDDLLTGRRTMVFCSLNSDGRIHAVPMWYGFVGTTMALLTKPRSQKVMNIRRNPHVTCMVDDGASYDELRGVVLYARATVDDDPAIVGELARSLWERYLRTDERPQPAPGELTAMANRRVVIRVRADSTASWDHRNLVRTESG